MCMLSQRYTEHWIRFVSYFANLVSSFQLFVSFSHSSERVSVCVRVCVWVAYVETLAFRYIFSSLLLYHTNFPHLHANTHIYAHEYDVYRLHHTKHNPHESVKTSTDSRSQFTVRINAFRMFRSLRSDLVVSTTSNSNGPTMTTTTTTTSFFVAGSASVY